MPGVEAQEYALVRDFAIIMTVAGGAILLFRKLNQPRYWATSSPGCWSDRIPFR